MIRKQDETQKIENILHRDGRTSSKTGVIIFLSDSNEVAVVAGAVGRVLTRLVLYFGFLHNADQNFQKIIPKATKEFDGDSNWRRAPRINYRVTAGEEEIRRGVRDVFGRRRRA